MFQPRLTVVTGFTNNPYRLFVLIFPSTNKLCVYKRFVDNERCTQRDGARVSDLRSTEETYFRLRASARAWVTRLVYSTMYMPIDRDSRDRSRFKRTLINPGHRGRPWNVAI